MKDGIYFFLFHIYSPDSLIFLERGAISKSQFDKSLGDLTIKMGMSGLVD